MEIHKKKSGCYLVHGNSQRKRACISQHGNWFKKIRLVFYNMEIDLRNQACNLQHGNWFKKSGL
jgi:hypothetical protein